LLGDAEDSGAIIGRGVYQTAAEIRATHLKKCNYFKELLHSLERE
jgi:hypothetical protein